MKIIIQFLLLISPVVLTAQNIRAYRSVNDLNIPELRWYTIAGQKVKPFHVLRAPVGSDQFTLISTIDRHYQKGDTLFFQVNDTTLTEKGLYQYYIETRDEKDSLVKSEIMYGHNMGNLPVPQVISFTAISATGSKSLILNWKLNYSFTVKALVLFRSRYQERGFEPVATLPPTAENYTDHVLISNESYFYFLQIRDFFGYLMPSVVIHGICTYAEKGYPPQNFSATLPGKKVELTMRKVGANVIGFRIYKQVDPSVPFRPAGAMIPVTGDSASFADTAVISPGMTRVRYYAMTVSDGYLESNASDTLDIRLPWNSVVVPPDEMDYSLDSSGMIRLFWSLNDLEPDVKGFNIFRSGKDGIPVKLNSLLILYPQNTYTDNSLKEYGSFIYSVESVSQGDVPSLIRTSVNVNREPIIMHVVISSRQVGSSVELSWINPEKPGLDSFYIFRKTADSKATMVGMVNPRSEKWTDTGVQQGDSYIYTLVAEFKDGTRYLVNDGVLVRVQ